MRLIRAAAVTLILTTVDGHAQTVAIPVRNLGRVVATSTTTFAAARPQLVALSDGRILVADATNRVVTMLDSSLANPQVVLDSAVGKNNSFTAGSFLTTFRGDSTLFFDRNAGTLVVIEPSGALGRTMPPPANGRTGFAAISAAASTPIASAFTTGPGMPVTSSALGLIFRWSAPGPPAPHVLEGQPDVVIRTEDSTFVVRMDVVTRKIDTLAKISTGQNTVRTYRYNGSASSGGLSLFAFYDDAVTTSDGSLALFHAREYRIEWINPDGTHTQAPRLNYAWQRVTDDDRRRIIDSINTRRTFQFDSIVAKRAADSARTGSGPMTTLTSISGGQRTQRQIPAPAPRPPVLVDPSEIPDYRPPTTSGAVLADRDNNVWIRPAIAGPSTASTAPSAQLWEVINRKGELADRVSVPAGRTIIGFGPGGIVYLAARDAATTTIEKVRWRSSPSPSSIAAPGRNPHPPLLSRSPITSPPRTTFRRWSIAWFPVFGDSSLFVDVAALCMLVVDPHGGLGRTMSVPLGPAGGLAYLNTASYGVTFDGARSLVSRVAGPTTTPQLVPGAPPVTVLDGDSGLIIRSNLATKKVDTVARVRDPGATGSVRRTRRAASRSPTWLIPSPWRTPGP